METNPLPEVQDNKTQALYTITPTDGLTITVNVDKFSGVSSETNKTLQRLETLVTQQQQSIEEIHQKLEDLTRKFEQFEASSPKIEISIKSEGFYEGWDLKHDMLTSHEYVARNDLLKILNKIQLICFTEDKKSIPVLLTTIKTYVVSKYERFPSGGGGEFYVNVNGDQIYTKIYNIIQFFNQKEFRIFNGHLNTLKDQICHPQYSTDRASFEKEYNFTWVEKK